MVIHRCVSRGLYSDLGVQQKGVLGSVLVCECYGCGYQVSNSKILVLCMVSCRYYVLE